MALTTLRAMQAPLGGLGAPRSWGLTGMALTTLRAMQRPLGGLGATRPWGLLSWH
jgi:hypothetical protein